MKFTLSWLKEHLDTNAALEDILKALNALGLEVEGVENPAERLTGFKVARVLAAAPHPQADKLQVLRVEAGAGPLQVVCGAPNARAGMVGVLGLPGAAVPANGLRLKVSAIRGVESHGMMCSTRELELGEDHDGILELPDDAPIGLDFASHAGLDDPVIEVAITPNRQDCMGVRGIARDLAAKGLGTLRPLALPSITEGGAAPDVRTEDPEGCPAFYARAVRGVRNGPAPEWMQRRLKAIGQKPISALVDITNYVMIDLGRPLHVYDMASLKGPLVARKARAGELVPALNGKTYAMTETMTVIADDDGAHDIGGIMGGERSGAQAGTTDVLIECAYFTPEGIARTGQALGLTSDARTRFERGVDPALLADGLDLATDHVLRLCGGTASPMTRAGEPPLTTRTLPLDPARCARLGGIDLPVREQAAILRRLGFPVSDETPMQVGVPSWRRDIDGPADLVEEIVRIAGLDRVESLPLPRAPGVARPTATPAQKQERRVRRAAASQGLHEAIHWSFIGEAEAALFGGGDWVLANPISEDMKVMRPTLLAGLLSAARRNQARGAGSIRLFEIGKRYFRAADGSSDERLTLGLVLAGEKTPRGWQTGKAKGFDAFDAKALALALLGEAGAPVANIQMFGEAGEAFHPGQSGTLRLGPKTVLARYGVLHPRLARAFDLDGSIVAAELHLDAVPMKRRSGFLRPPYAPPALQAVTRDFAFLVPTGLEADALVRAIRAADKTSIVAAGLFDRFERDGQRSMAVEITLQPSEKSFTEADLKTIADQVVAAAARLGAVLRG